MPWVRLDDRFPSHRKVALLSDRAFRLYVSALCWSSENLTEGKILDRELAVVARVRNTTATARELEAANLWERVDDGWMIHDFLEYNPDRARVKAERQANAARQKAWRDRKREARKAEEDGARNAPRNGVTHDSAEPENDTTATRTKHDGDTNARESDPTNPASSQASGFRNGVNNAAPSPSPSPVPPTEVPTSKPDSTIPRIGDRPRIPENARPLVEQITAAGIYVGWDLTTNDWFLIESLIKRCTIPALVQHAIAAAQGARGRIRSGTYFLPGWRSLPDVPADVHGRPALPAAVGYAGRQPLTGTDARVAGWLALPTQEDQ